MIKMFVASNIEESGYNIIFEFLPKKVRRYMYTLYGDTLEEIRIRQGLPVVLQYRDASFFLDKSGKTTQCPENALIPTKADMSEALELISSSSLYAHENDIKKGYITVCGGNRVGITGTGVIENGDIKSIKNISGLNYRIAHEIIGCADKVCDMIINKNGIKNTLIISPPECGKTTLLRDAVRTISNKMKKVCVVDERNELSGSFEGEAAYDLGACTDVLSDVPKAEGMRMVLRSMSPEVICTDELGGKADIDAVAEAVNSGVSIIATVHAKDEQQLRNRTDLSMLADYFECFVVLGRSKGAGTVEAMYCVD